MEKASWENYTAMRCIHTFFCDNCGKELGYATEYDDGYYGTIGEYKQYMTIIDSDPKKTYNGRYCFKANFCEECAKEKTKDIAEALEDLGFEKE